MRKVRLLNSWWIVGLSVAALGACSKQSAAPATPAAPATSAAPATPAEKVEAEGAAATPETDPCHGRMASMTEWFGMGYQRRVFGCDHGRFLVQVEQVESQGESAPPDSVAIDSEAWEEVWTRLEDAGWRTMTGDCPETDEAASWQNTGVDFEITDGKTTVKLSCNGQPNETHLAVYEILGQADDLAGDL